MKKLMDTSGQSPCDFIALVGFGPTLANMGITGAIGMTYILAVGGDLNGPVIGAIFTVVGFAAFGEHPRNIVPIMAGVFLGSLAKPWSADDPSFLLAALFGTALAHRRELRMALGRRRRFHPFVCGAERRPDTTPASTCTTTASLPASSPQCWCRSSSPSSRARSRDARRRGRRERSGRPRMTASRALSAQKDLNTPWSLYCWRCPLV